MLNRTLIVLSMTLAMIVAAEPLQTVHGIIMTPAEWTALNSTDTFSVEGQKAEGRGNGFVRALKAPFKAFGRLFGGGKKSKAKLERISEKDMERFESAPAIQVSKTTTPAAASSTGTATQGLAVASPVENTGEKNSPEAIETIARDHLEKGRALLNSHDLNGAIGELSRAASVNAKLSEASSLLGVAYWRKGLRDLAERSFETAVRIEKNDAQNLNNLGFLLYENGDYEKATKYLKRAARLAPSDARIWNNLGLAQAERGDFDEAYKSFARAQGEFKGHLNVAARLERQGSSKKALKHLEKALALQPNSRDVLAKLISLYSSTGDEKQALKARSSLSALGTLANATAK